MQLKELTRYKWFSADENDPGGNGTTQLNDKAEPQTLNVRDRPSVSMPTVLQFR